MQIKKLFGTKLKELRKSRNLTQERLSELVNVDTKHISFIETGKNFPSSELLSRFAEALNIELKDFFDFSNKKPDNELVTEINELVSELDSKKLQLAHKILFDIAHQ